MTADQPTTPRSETFMPDFDKIAPNPYSPYATADLNLHHLFPSRFGRPLTPGRLTLTECERTAVVPESPPNDVTDAIRNGDLGNLPKNLCTPCMLAATGRFTADRFTPQACWKCEDVSSQNELCATCRQDLHEEWWPTRTAEQSGEASR